MIKHDLNNAGLPKRRHSMYFGLFAVIILGILCALLINIAVSQIAQLTINTHYVTEEKQRTREEEYLVSLKSFCDVNRISSEDTEKIAKWVIENPYVYVIIDKGDERLFTSDAYYGESRAKGHSLAESVLSYPDSVDLLTRAEGNLPHTLSLSDGDVSVYVAEFTEYLYFDIVNIMSRTASVFLMGIFLIIYVSRIISRIKRLERDVAIVTGGVMTYKIGSYGSDEIATLSENIENMRNSILEKLQLEREARDANTELIASISHDLRTPLTVLIGYIDMMKNHEGCDETMKSYISASENTAMRLKQLSEDMFKYSLAFCDTEDGVKLEEYDAETLWQQLLAEHILLITERGFTIDNKLPSFGLDGMMVRTDPRKLMRIVDNIFSNLSKYADRKFPIEIKVGKVGSYAVMECKNRIASEPATTESNGIGLKTCTRLARAVADSFYYGEEEGLFVTRLYMKLYSEGNKNDKL